MFDVKKDALEYARENKELLKEAARRHKPTLSELANRNSYYTKPAFLQRFEGLTWNDILDEDEKKEFLAQEEPETKLAQNTVGNNMNTNNTMSDADMGSFNNISNNRKFNYWELIPTYNLGRFAADSTIAYNHFNDMKKTGKYLVNTFGKNAGAGIDDYYHPLLQCHLAQMGEDDQIYGIILGEGKEAFDYWRNPRKLNKQELMIDREKDLNLNDYGSILGQNNRTTPCVDLLKDHRTNNMKKLHIW
ncbi:MAG: hypothetical protein IJ689_05480 [Alphaproteobacteria bacterium]|nr:hypothetical protein [Alphaproteobacteria bacterium]